MIVLWRVTTRCNLACSFCAYDRRLGFPRTLVDPAEVERFGALLGAYRADSGEDILISWLGGEPLLWPGVLALSQRLRNEHGLRISVTTNGTTLLRPGIARAVAETFDEVTISVDALAQTHERLRGWSGGWTKLAEGIDRLSTMTGAQASPLIRANVVLMRDTLSEFSVLCDRLADWGVKEITFNQLGGRDRPEFYSDHALRPDDAIRLRMTLPSLAARMAKRGVRLCANDSYLERIEATAAGRPIPVLNCGPRRPTVFIDEHNRIACCSFTQDGYSVPTNTVRTVSDIAALRARLDAGRLANLPAVCSDCPSTQVFAKFGT